MSNCKEINKKKKNRQLVGNMAVKFPAMINADVRFFWKQDPVWGLQYDFEPAELNRHIETTLEIFKP